MDYKQSIDGGLRELALFAGAGGGILGGKLLGWRTVCAVEIEPYPTSVLCARQNDGILAPFPIWDDVCTFDGKPWRRRVDVVSGGFPCQDISAAGKGAGIENGERSGLWREFARIISEVRPRYVFVENSPLLVSRGLGIVLGDLAALGYDVEWGVLGACDVGAPHKRERIWIVADANSKRKLQPQRVEQDKRGRAGNSGQESRNVADSVCYGGKAGVADTKRREEGHATKFINGGMACNFTSEGRQDGECGAVGGREEEQKLERSGGEFGEEAVGNSESFVRYDAKAQDDSRGSQLPMEVGGSGSTEGRTWWAIEPYVGRVANGVAARVDRLKAIGNGQVPTVAATAFRILTNR